MGILPFPTVKKTFRICVRLDRIPACDRRADIETDGRTDRHLERYSPRYAYASRGKNSTTEIQ